MAATAEGFAVLAGLNIDNDAVLSVALSKGEVGEDKGLEFVDPVEKSFDEQCNGRINGEWWFSNAPFAAFQLSFLPTNSDEEAKCLMLVMNKYFIRILLLNRIVSDNGSEAKRFPEIALHNAA